MNKVRMKPGEKLFHFISLAVNSLRSSGKKEKTWEILKNDIINKRNVCTTILSVNWWSRYKDSDEFKTHRISITLSDDVQRKTSINNNFL